MTGTVAPERVYQRVMHWADRDPATGCLVSRYSVGGPGYAQVGWSTDGKTIMTTCHRVVWVHHHGPIPDGMTVDHTCKNRRCIEITHLRLLTNFENARRTSGRDWPLGECAQGHPNTELRSDGAGRKRCRLCKNAARRRRAAARRSSTDQP